MWVMLALTACGDGEGQRPPVNTSSSDASDEKPVEAGTDAPLEAAPVDAGVVDAMPDVPAIDAGPVAMCCYQPDDAGRHGHLCNASGVDCDTDAGFCTINKVLGQFAPCELCAPGQTFSTCEGDAGGNPLTCQSGPQAIMNGNDLVCLCTGSATCVYEDTTRCTAECR
jgi:hypothetical protein